MQTNGKNIVLAVAAATALLSIGIWAFQKRRGRRSVGKDVLNGAVRNSS